jgi:hypothetical protein
MIRKLIVTIATCMLPLSAFATPQKIEMIFLSPLKVSMLLEQMDRYNKMKMSAHLAQAESERCVPMGDGCFHPQYGYIEKKETVKTKPNLLDEEERKVELKNFNSLETSLVNCDKNNYFDIFCGKEKANTAPAEVEVWFAISSSLKTVDYNRDPEQCARRSFMEKVMAVCKGKVNVSVYNTSIKQIGDHSGACLAYGTNDQKRLLGWMKDSRARQLLIVTDIDEMSTEMRNFLESNGAKMTGDGVKAFTSNDLVDYAKEFTKMCR